MGHIADFIAELDTYCAGRGIARSTFCNRATGNTYAIESLQGAALKIERTIGKLRDAMDADIPAPRLPAPIPAPVRMEFDLPVPPSTNRLHKGAGANKHRTEKYSAWLREAGMEIIAQRSVMRCKVLPPGSYFARVRIAMDDPADADNRLKALFDLLVRMRVTPDDRHLFGSSFGRSPKVASGRISIVIRPMPKAKG